MKVFNNELIRNTNTATSVILDVQDWATKTIMINNGLNQTVELQCQVSSDQSFTSIFNIGSNFDVSASSKMIQTCDNYFPYFRIVAKCGSAPSSGGLTVDIMKFAI